MHDLFIIKSYGIRGSETLKMSWNYYRSLCHGSHQGDATEQLEL